MSPIRCGLVRGNWPERVSDRRVPVRLVALPSPSIPSREAYGTTVTEVADGEQTVCWELALLHDGTTAI